MTHNELVKFVVENRNKIAEGLKDDEFDIIEYRRLVIEEMKKLGAKESDYNLLGIGALRAGVKYKRSPADVAWAIIQ